MKLWANVRPGEGEREREGERRRERESESERARCIHIYIYINNLPFKYIWMWLKQQPSPSHHHFYSWYGYHSRSWVVSHLQHPPAQKKTAETLKSGPLRGSAQSLRETAGTTGFSLPRVWILILVHSDYYIICL